MIAGKPFSQVVFSQMFAVGKIKLQVGWAYHENERPTMPCALSCRWKINAHGISPDPWRWISMGRLWSLYLAILIIYGGMNTCNETHRHATQSRCKRN